MASIAPDELSLAAGRFDEPILRGCWRLVFFWASATAVFAVACSGLEQYTGAVERVLPLVWPQLPESLRSDLEQLPHDQLIQRIHRQVTVPVRALLFIAGVLYLGSFVVGPVRTSGMHVQVFSRRNILRVTMVVAAMLALVFMPRLRAMGVVYGEVSVDPFAQETGWMYRRLLVPALAYFLQFKGYLLYNVFHWLLTWLLVAVALAYVELKSSPLRWWQCLSIASVYPLVHQFQTPGYADVLVFLTALLALIVPADKWVRAALFILALVTHEAAACVVFLPLVAFVFPRRELWLHLAILAAYVGFFLANFSFDPAAAMHAQTGMGSSSSFRKLAENPLHALLGVFFAYKLLWLAVLATIFALVRRGKYQVAGAVVAIVALPVLQLPLGVDTLRLAGFGGIAVWWCVAWLRTVWPASAFNLLLGANLAVPSAAVAQGLGVVLLPGLYKVAVDLFSG